MATKKKVWRPTKKTSAVVRKLLTALRNGSSRDSCTTKAWIGRRTFYEWLEADEDFRTKVEYAEFERMETVHNEKKKLIKKWYRPAIEKELKSKERKVYGDKKEITGEIKMITEDDLVD